MTSTTTTSDVFVDSAPEPDFAALFPMPDASVPLCDEHDGCRTCDSARWYAYTPRTMAYVAAQARAMAQLWDDSIDDSVTRANVLGALLPPLVRSAPPDWYRTFARCFTAISDRIEAGVIPFPRCTAEEMALHIVLGVCAVKVLEWGEELGDGLFGAAAQLDEHETDARFDVLIDVMFEDHDVLMLFEDPFVNGIPAPVAKVMGIVNLDMVDWFQPFYP